MKSWLTKLGGSEFKVMRLNDASPPDLQLDTPERVVEFITPRLLESLRYTPDTENMGVVFLNTRRRAVGFEIVTNGTLDTLLVHPREIYRPAVIVNAAAIILFHNHPSGDPTPSEADVKVTRDLVRAGQLMRIECLDHLVLGRSTAERLKSWSSLRELGYMPC
jgi:DNA repair protein RadC